MDLSFSKWCSDEGSRPSVAGWRTQDDFLSTHTRVFSTEMAVETAGCAEIQTWIRKVKCPRWISLTQTLRSCLINFSLTRKPNILKKLQVELAKATSKGDFTRSLPNRFAPILELLSNREASVSESDTIELADALLHELETIWHTKVERLLERTLLADRDRVVDALDKGRHQLLWFKAEVIPKLVTALLETPETRRDPNLDYFWKYLEYPEIGDGIMYELAERLIAGHPRAGEVLREMEELTKCDMQKLCEFILSAPKLNDDAKEFLERHGSRTDNDPTHWPPTAIGFLPFSQPPLTIDSVDLDVQVPFGTPIPDQRLGWLLCASRMKGYQRMDDGESELEIEEFGEGERGDSEDHLRGRGGRGRGRRPRGEFHRGNDGREDQGRGRGGRGRGRRPRGEFHRGNDGREYHGRGRGGSGFGGSGGFQFGTRVQKRE